MLMQIIDESHVDVAVLAPRILGRADCISMRIHRVRSHVRKHVPKFKVSHDLLSVKTACRYSR